MIKRIIQDVSRHVLFWPAATLLLLVALDVAHRSSFLSITLLEGHLFGAPIDISNRAAPLIIVSHVCSASDTIPFSRNESVSCKSARRGS